MSRLSLFSLIALALVAVDAAAQPTCPPPSAAAVVDAVIRNADLDDADRYRRQVRAAALLPNSARVELRAADDDIYRLQSRLDQDFDELLDVDGSDLTDVRQSGVDHLREVRVIVSWRLSDLAWSPDHATAIRLAQSDARDRTDLTDLTLELYFEWLRARDESPEEFDAYRVLELHARLDALTGGWFRAVTACQRDPINPP